MEFEFDKIYEADSIVEKLTEFIDTHIPDGDEVSTINMMLLGFKDARNNTVAGADNLV